MYKHFPLETNLKITSPMKTNAPLKPFLNWIKSIFYWQTLELLRLRWLNPIRAASLTLQQYMSYMNLIQPRWHTLKKIKSQLQFYNPSITKIKTKLIYNWANSIYWSNQHPNLSCVSVFVRRGHFWATDSHFSLQLPFPAHTHREKQQRRDFLLFGTPDRTWDPPRKTVVIWFYQARALKR